MFNLSNNDSSTSIVKTKESTQFKIAFINTKIVPFHIRCTEEITHSDQ